VETANTADRASAMDRSGILYPLMVIAAIAVIAFSAIGIVTMMGWMPEALSSPGAVKEAKAAEIAPRAVLDAASSCVDCAAAPARPVPAQARTGG
jgi:hypothetical protein